LEEPIRQIGEFKVEVRLHRGVNAEITVHIVKEE
jgi:ribosomal protein L9